MFHETVRIAEQQLARIRSAVPDDKILSFSVGEPPLVLCHRRCMHPMCNIARACIQCAT